MPDKFENRPPAEALNSNLEKSLFTILKFLAWADKNQEADLYAFDPEDQAAFSREKGDGQLKLSDTGDLQIKQGKNWLLVNGLSSAARARLRLDEAGLNSLQKYQDKKAKETPYRSPILSKAERESRKKGVSYDQGLEIMGPDFLGMRAVEAAYGKELDAEDIPKIPFSEAELERAKELNQFLILRVDKAPDGEPLTMKKMKEIMEPKLSKVNRGKVLYKVDPYQNEDFYTTDTPKAGWALVSKDNIPNSTRKNYFQQTQELVKYITNEVFKDQKMPLDYQDAIVEFERYYARNFQGKNNTEIRLILLDTDWRKYAKELGDLKINRFTRHAPVEWLGDSLVYFATDSRLLKDKYTWTNRRFSDSRLVYLGYSSDEGALVDEFRPGASDGRLGVSLSRIF